MAEKWIGRESGPGYVLVKCRKCGWREMVTTSESAAYVGGQHLAMVHGLSHRGSNYTTTALKRSQ